jgi:hypothetical protein
MCSSSEKGSYPRLIDLSVNQVQKKKRSNLEGGFGAADDVGREGRGGVDQVEEGHVDPEPAHSCRPPARQKRNIFVS